MLPNTLPQQETKPVIQFDPKKSSYEKKENSIDALLRAVEPIDFYKSCKSLGWIPSTDCEGKEKPPLQRHIKIAIVRELIKLAERNDWQLCMNEGHSYLYNSQLWLSLDPAELENLLTKVAIRQGYSEIEASDAVFTNKLTDQFYKACFFSRRQFEKRSMINLANGTLVLGESGPRIKGFDSEDFLTHQLPFEYDKAATNELFLKYLDEVLPDKYTQRTLQEISGYFFIKGLKLEKIFFLYGSGSNGKSVFFEVIQGVLGRENVSNYSIESLTDNNGYYRAQIKDKILNYGTDVKLTRIDSGKFKTLASNEPIEARFPYGRPFTISDYAKLIFNVNKLDVANLEYSYGFSRRLLIVPFSQTIHEDAQDKRLHDRILENPAGVLNWMIEGAERVLKNESIFESQECKKSKSRFLTDADSVALFVEGDRYSKSTTGKISLKLLYSGYKEFCMDDGYRPLGKKNFSERLEGLGFIKLFDRNHQAMFDICQNHLS